MKTLIMPQDLEKIEGYPYRLTNWLKKRENLDKIVARFVKYKCEDRAVIVQTGAGWCVYTDGKDIQEGKCW